MKRLTEVVDGNLMIKDEKIRKDVSRKLDLISKYCKKTKNEIESLLGNEVDVRIIMNLTPKDHNIQEDKSCQT